MTEHLLAGRYRLEHEIGAGGMGRVWRARDVRLDREVAVKTVDLAGVTDPSLAGRFQREIVLTARLTSPYTVTVFDGGLDGRTAYLVMELLRGESLAEAISRRGPLSVGRALEVAREVTLGLAAAHAIGLVHRDIKPANVMLTDGGRVKLLDFGIAQLTGQADPHLTQPSMTIGTAAYMSPEQASGLRVDSATDLYALGCLITTMLAGRPPFDGDQPVVVAAHQINTAPPRLADLRPGVPPGWTRWSPVCWPRTRRSDPTPPPPCGLSNNCRPTRSLPPCLCRHPRRPWHHSRRWVRPSPVPTPSRPRSASLGGRACRRRQRRRPPPARWQTCSNRAGGGSPAYWSA